MYISDMHCDSLMLRERGEALVKNYNVSKKYPYLQFFAHFSGARFGTAERRREHLMKNLSAFHSGAEENSLICVRSAADLREAVSKGTASALFSVEGGGGLMPHSEEITVLFEGGLRVYGPVWDENELSASAWSKDDFGLTEAGRTVLSRVMALGIIPDVSHMSDRGFFELCEMTDKPIIATHSNFRDICKSPRNLTREMALEIKRRGGVIGLNIYPPFLTDGERATSDDILRHVDFALEQLGEDTLGFGFDIDGTDGLYPEGYSERKSIHDGVCELLLSHYGEGITKKIVGENVLRFLEDNLPK